MEVHFTPEQEAELAQMAREAGGGPEDLVKGAALRLLDEDRQFRAAVAEGLRQADQSQFIDEPEMDALFERMLQS